MFRFIFMGKELVLSQLNVTHATCLCILIHCYDLILIQKQDFHEPGPTATGSHVSLS